MKNNELKVFTTNDLDKDEELSLNRIFLNYFKCTKLFFSYINMYTYKIINVDDLKESDIYIYLRNYVDTLEIFKKLNFEQISRYIFVNTKENIIIDYSIRDIYDQNKAYIFFIIKYNENTDLEVLKELENTLRVDKFIDDTKKPVFSYIVANVNDGFSTITSELKNNLEIDIENSYNLNCDFKSINDKLNSKKGLYLFSGNPGTGKTTLIKYLSQQNENLRFFILSNSIVHKICDPNFISFALLNLKNAVIILEDSETLLTSRKISKSLDITSSLLNLTDGILSDMLNLKIICTLNTTENIDTALLRKGRLQMHVLFNSLSEQQAINLSNKINKKLTSKNYTLAEIYNSDEDNQSGLLEPNNKLGYK
jgi:hypothetical protein